MRLDKAARMIIDEFSVLDFKIDELTNEKLTMTASGINAKEYFDDDIYCKIVAYSSGTVHVFFTFDQLSDDLMSLRLINDFNNNVPFLKANIVRIKGDTYLELHAVNISCSDEDVLASTVSFFFGELLDEVTLEYLQPLTDITF